MSNRHRSCSFDSRICNRDIFFSYISGICTVQLQCFHNSDTYPCFRSVFLRIRGSTVIHCRFAFDANIVVAGALDAGDIIAFLTRQYAQYTAKPVTYTAVSGALFTYTVSATCKHMFCLTDKTLAAFHIIRSYFLL